MGSMEKIAGACAMGWCIELEKGLRSETGRSIESIQRIGPRLKQWLGEPQPQLIMPLTIPLCNMFDLVPGEDRLFADSILFRLAGAFVSGDKATKICVIKVFLSTLRHCKTKDGQAHGIFSNMSMENRLDLLMKVKVLLCAECVESRALTLILFGCWADMAKDSAEIRHAVLSALSSCHVLEVKATLFAAACFSEVSDDFGFVFLERLLNMMTSPKASPALKLAGARAFSKMQSSLLLAIKSYKVGAELLQRFCEEDILAAMLISLTKLSRKTGILISEQVGLLSSLLAQKTSLHMQGTILRCLRYILAGAACLVPMSAVPLKILFRMVNEPNMPSPVRSDILQILLKMIAYGLPSMPLNDFNEFMKQLRYVENVTRSSILSERLLALEVLVCVSNKIKGRTDIIFEGSSVACFSGVVSALCDQISQLTSVVSGAIEIFDIDKELRSMLKLLIVLVENHSDLGYVILDNLHLLIENRVNLLMPAVAVQISAVHKVVSVEAEEYKISVRKFMFYIYRFLVAFLEILDEACAASDQVVHKLKHLVDLVCGSSLFDHSIHTHYALLLYTHVNWVCLLSDNKDTTDFAQGMGRYSNTLLDCEARIHECAVYMLAGEDNWYAYRAGKYAACEGGWYMANFIFQSLETRVQSGLCCQWLKFLVRISHSEKNIEVLLHQACYHWSPDHVPYVVGNIGRDIISSGYIEKLVDACNDISSSDKVLEIIALWTQPLHFQRWFLTLRVKILLVVVDLLQMLDTCLTCKDGIESIQHAVERVSPKLRRLAEECDLIASSFMDMDSKSLKLISGLAFTCSLLAFCIEFTNATADTPKFKNRTGDCLYVLVQDLAGRLWHTDPETCNNLMSLLKKHGVHESSLHLLPRFRISKVECISEDILTVCRSSVKKIMGLRNKSSNVHDKGTALQGLHDGVQLLLHVVAAWMRIPFRIPKYFFRVRPSIGSMLISSSVGGGKHTEISVSLGSHLALNLCIQLKNVPSDICLRFSKIYCILYCKTSFLVMRPNSNISREAYTGFQASKIDMLIDLNKKLQCYVMKQTREFMTCRDHHSDGEAVEVCVCFETNGSSQGFSTCVLDVSTFPLGSYQIHWHSGGVDSEGAYWSILPLSPGPVIRVTE